MEQQPIEVRHDGKELARCKGCLKEVAKNSLLRHVGRHQSCKDYYGDQYQEMLNENKKATQKKVEAKRKEEKIQYQRRYDKENKTNRKAKYQEKKMKKKNDLDVEWERNFFELMAREEDNTRKQNSGALEWTKGKCSKR